MDWLKAIAKAIGLADFLARWVHDEEVKKEGEQAHEVKDLRAQGQAAIDGAKIHEVNHALSDDDLNAKLDRLRNDGPGDRQSGAAP